VNRATDCKSDAESRKEGGGSILLFLFLFATVRYQRPQVVRSQRSGSRMQSGEERRQRIAFVAALTFSSAANDMTRRRRVVSCPNSNFPFSNGYCCVTDCVFGFAFWLLLRRRRCSCSNSRRRGGNHIFRLSRLLLRLFYRGFSGSTGSRIKSHVMSRFSTSTSTSFSSSSS